MVEVNLFYENKGPEEIKKLLQEMHHAGLLEDAFVIVAKGGEVLSSSALELEIEGQSDWGVLADYLAAVKEMLDGADADG